MPPFPSLEVILSADPSLLAYLQSNPPDVSLLRNSFDLSLKYVFMINAWERQSLNFIEMCGFYGKADHLKALLEGSPESTDAIWADVRHAIKWAAQNGHLDVIQYLETYLSMEERKKAVKAVEYAAIRSAAKNGHLDVIQYLETYLSIKERKKAVKAVYYYAIWSAAANGHLDVIQYLETYLSIEERKRAVKAVSYAAIWHATQPIVQHFLNLDTVFSYAELHDDEYGNYVDSFVAEKLAAIRERQGAYELNDPDEVFDLPKEEARLCFYILRNLIRQGSERIGANAELISENIRFLLEIPRVRNLCHRNLHRGGENELLRLANRLGNHAAASLLLEVPEVQRLAAANNFYASDRELGGLDLRQIAQDHESSMVALNESERKIVEEVQAHYSAKMSAAGKEDKPAVLENVEAYFNSGVQDSPDFLRFEGPSGLMQLLSDKQNKRISTTGFFSKRNPIDRLLSKLVTPLCQHTPG